MDDELDPFVSSHLILGGGGVWFYRHRLNLRIRFLHFCLANRSFLTLI
jgi:hypothetical protein